MNPVISLENVSAGYPQTPVLQNINLALQPLDFVGLIGPNGGGKTTLLKVLLGLLKPQQGKVKILGKPVQQGRRHLGYVPQLLELDRTFPICVRDVVGMGRLGRRKIFRRYSSKDHDIVARCLEQVGMTDKGDRSIGELSGGERQRVYIARALASEPKILLLDEPTANVDSRVQISIYELLRELNEYITILMISHDLTAVSSYVKTVGCLNKTLHYHHDKQITPQMIEAAYQCPVDLITRSVSSRAFSNHGDRPENVIQLHSDECNHA